MEHDGSTELKAVLIKSDVMMKLYDPKVWVGKLSFEQNIINIKTCSQVHNYVPKWVSILEGVGAFWYVKLWC